MSTKISTQTSKWATYQAYKDSGIEWLGEIPEGWQVLRLKHIAKVNFSNVDKHTVEGEKSIRLCNYVDVYYNDYISEDFELMHATATKAEIEKFTLKSGDVIITKDSEAWDDIAVSAYVPEDMPSVLCGYHLARIRTIENQADGKYLFRAFCSHGINYQFKVVTTGVTRYGLGKYGLDNALFILPSINEQTAIATFLDRETSQIDALIEKKKRQIELLKEKRSALISHAVTKGLDPKAKMKDSGIEWIGKIPEHWIVWKLKHGFKCIGSGTTPNTENRGYYDGNIPWVTTSELREQYIDETTNKLTEEALQDYSALRFYPAGSLLFAMYGATVGRLGILKISATINQACLAFSEPITLETRFTYYWLWMRRPILIAQSAGGGQPNLSQGDLKKLRIPAPKISEQRAIANHLDHKTAQIDTLIEKVQKSIDLLHEKRSTLITAAVTGKIDVREKAA